MRSTNALHLLAVPKRPIPAIDSALGPVGNTPVAWITSRDTSGGRGYWAKLEGFNPGGIKDRSAMHMVRAARRRGDLLPGAPIVESTSGTLGLGLALAGLSFGHPITLVSDPGLEPLMARLLISRGARLEIVPEPHPDGGWQEARRIRVSQLMERMPGAWCPDQYHNPDNVAAYAPLAAELIAQLPWIDALVCAVGTGGHSAGIHRMLRQSFPDIKLVGVDTVGSTIFGQPSRPRLMRGLGSSIYPRNVDYGAFSEVHWVSAAEAVTTCRQLAASSYHSGGWSTGAVALVADWLAQTLPADRTIVAVFPDAPWRYWNTVYDDDYCRQHDVLGQIPARDPDEISDPGEREVTRWTRCQRVLDPTAQGRSV